MQPVTVIGAGLAGSECAWQLAKRGVPVRLVEMKPQKYTPAHHSPLFGELVCSNSLRSDELTNAVGLLKEELRRLGSLILACADATRVEAGGCLAVDRQGFSRLVTERIHSHRHPCRGHRGHRHGTPDQRRHGRPDCQTLPGVRSPLL